MTRSNVTFAVLAVVSVCVGASRAGEWPGFLGPNRDAVSTEKNIAVKWPETGPKVLWTKDLGWGYGGAAVVDGEVFVLDRNPEEGDVLRVLDLNSGDEKWSFAYDAKGRLQHAGSRSTPSVDADNVYTVGGFGDVYCISRKTHKPVWSTNLNKAYAEGTNKWGIAQSPLLVDGKVIVTPTSPDSPGLVAFDKDTGKVVWESEKLGGDDYSSPILRTVEGVQGILIITHGNVTFVDPKTGKTTWQYGGYEVKFAIPAPTVLSDGQHIFVTGGYDGGSVMIRVTKKGDAYDTAEVFRLQEGCQLHPAIEHGGYLYMNCNENSFLKRDKRPERGLACLDPKTGKFVWKTGADPNFERGALMLVNDTLFIMDGETGTLHTARATSEGYREISRAKLLEGKGKEVWAPMSLANGLMIIRDQHQMKCLDLRENAAE
ncbi:MAG: PQQ-binding-like beta-propeller repeat protein [Phycisphaera sp.]|nr:PQQ-binding-like beta-propeller repeat protein [Phycisphaera sp.]